MVVWKKPDEPNDQHDYDWKNTFKYEEGVCALSWWEPIKLLEEGSISDIHLCRRRERFQPVKYKEKRDVMSLAKKLKPWEWKMTKKKQEDEDEVYVLKSIMKDHIGDDDILEEMRQEIHTMSRLDHPNICRLIEAYERRRHIYLVMEYCSGGNLAQRIPMEESGAATVIKKILLAVEYMHSKGVAHRDIKLENIMVDRNGEIKLIDFGLSTAYLSDEYKIMSDKVGTLYSMAPQVLEGKYDEKCDLWSVGVVAYLLLSGDRPFWGPPGQMPWSDRRKIMIELIKQCKYSPLTGRMWSDVSDLAKMFVKSLLQMDPMNRPSPKQALQSQWIKSVTNATEQSERFSLDETSKERAAQVDLLHQRLWQLLSTGFSEGEIDGLRAYIEALDENGDCFVSVAELHRALSDASESSHFCSKNDVDAAFDSCDDTSMKLNYVDFFVEVNVGKSRYTVEKLAKELDSLDVNNTRLVAVHDLNKVAHGLLPLDVANDVLKNMHIGTDDMVDTSDFLQHVTKRLMRGSK